VRIRLTEVLSALSLTTDLGAGVPFEKGLRTCVVASAFGSAVSLPLDEQRSVFHAALLRSIGCTAHAPENAAMFGDDMRFQRALKELDPADWETFSVRFGEWDKARQQELLGVLVEETPTTGVYAARSGCEVSAALGARLGIEPGAISALGHVLSAGMVRAFPMVAAAHHERLDGSGYHRNARGLELDPAARVLAAADEFAAMTESRPYRPALAVADAARELFSGASAGKLDPGAAAAVIEAAGLPRPQASWPSELTGREVDVLRLCARGMTNREIAEALVVSARTVQHHLASIYDKTGRRTRAGAAVFAV